MHLYMLKHAETCGSLKNHANTCENTRTHTKSWTNMRTSSDHICASNYSQVTAA